MVTLNIAAYRQGSTMYLLGAKLAETLQNARSGTIILGLPPIDTEVMPSSANTKFWARTSHRQTLIGRSSSIIAGLQGRGRR